MGEGTKDPRVRLLCETIQRLEELRTEAKDTARGYRERIETIEAEVRVLAEEIRTGQRVLFDDERSGDAADTLGAPKDETMLTLRVPGKEPVTATMGEFKRATQALKARRGARA